MEEAIPPSQIKGGPSDPRVAVGERVGREAHLLEATIQPRIDPPRKSFCKGLRDHSSEDSSACPG